MKNNDNAKNSNPFTKTKEEQIIVKKIKADYRESMRKQIPNWTAKSDYYTIKSIAT